MVVILPPFGLSDHNSITICPKRRSKVSTSYKIVMKRDTRPSRKAELGRCLSIIDWNVISTANTCEEKYNLISAIITTGMDILMPERKVKFHKNDVLWVTKEFKELINLRQRAFFSGNTDLFRFYRNRVNRKRKSLRAKFYASSINCLKNSKPKQWWSLVKRISGMKTSCSSLLSHLQVENIDHLSPYELANLISTPSSSLRKYSI